MKRALLVLLCILACFVFVSCTEEPEEPKGITIAEIGAASDTLFEVQETIKHEGPFFTYRLYLSGDEEEVSYDSEENEIIKYTLGQERTVVIEKDGAKKYEDGTDASSWFATYESENEGWNWDTPSKTIAKYSVNYKGETSTITFTEEVTIFDDGSSSNNYLYQVSYSININGTDVLTTIMKISYDKITNNQTVTYFSLNGYETATGLARLFMVSTAA